MPDDAAVMRFTQRLKQYRQAAGLNQEQLGAEVAHAEGRTTPYTQGAVAGWESADDYPKVPERVFAIEKVLKVEPGALSSALKDLRHMVATQLLAAGVDVRTVAGRLGHATPTLTMSTYAAWLPERDQAAAGEIGRLLDAAAGGGEEGGDRRGGSGGELGDERDLGAPGGGVG